jgi:hypothetical protein
MEVSGLLIHVQLNSDYTSEIPGGLSKTAQILGIT